LGIIIDNTSQLVNVAIDTDIFLIKAQTLFCLEIANLEYILTGQRQGKSTGNIFTS